MRIYILIKCRIILIFINLVFYISKKSKFMKRYYTKSIIVLAVLLFSSYISTSAVEPKAKDSIRVEVIYFHATQRCPGCIAIEELTESCMDGLFSKELKDSTTIYRSIDFLEPANEHFQDEYKFDFQTLILSKKVNGKEVKWKNLDKIWDLYANPEKYARYLESEVRKMLKK